MKLEEKAAKSQQIPPQSALASSDVPNTLHLQNEKNPDENNSKSFLLNILQGDPTKYVSMVSIHLLFEIQDEEFFFKVKTWPRIIFLTE